MLIQQKAKQVALTLRIGGWKMIDLEEAFREASEEMLSERGKCVRSWKKKGPYYTLVEILEKTVACSIL